MMNEVKVIVDGVEYVARPKTESAEKTRTGYERVELGEEYYVDGGICIHDGHDTHGQMQYESAAYYNHKTIGDNNSRADRLMRKLRQWQALNDEPVDWNNDYAKYSIYYDYKQNILKVYDTVFYKGFFIYFTTVTKAKEAIAAFRTELIWYFTEYVSRLDEPRR